uniref:Uncharacterized protein n=1 Tax=Sinocyclocheilus rhinocerous TaxID=307959 RepID=A0A673HP57_9TELE
MEDYHKPDQQTVQALRNIANRLRINSIKATTAVVHTINSVYVCPHKAASLSSPSPPLSLAHTQPVLSSTSFSPFILWCY